MVKEKEFIATSCAGLTVRQIAQEGGGSGKPVYKIGDQTSRASHVTYASNITKAAEIDG